LVLVRQTYRLLFETEVIFIEDCEDPAKMINRALRCVTQDLEMLRDETWVPDEDSIVASLDQLECLKNNLQDLRIID